MMLIKIINDKEFQNARLITYLILFILYIYLAYFSHFQCAGCPLCGMTRAVKSLLRLDFKSAFEFNKLVWVFCVVIPIIAVDLIIIVKTKIRNRRNDL